MSIIFYWWGIKATVDQNTFNMVLQAVSQGQTAVQNLLNELGFGWLGVLATALLNWGVSVLRAMDGNCGSRGLALNVPWSLWGANISCP